MENKDVLNKMEEIYNLFYKNLKKDESIINSNSKIKYIFSYSMVLFDYGLDIVNLQKLNRNGSIEAISRDLLECYSYIKRLLYYYNIGEKQYYDYVKFLVYEDMEQNRKIYNSLKEDRTIDDFSRRDNDMKDILMLFENLIERFFEDEATKIDKNNREESLLNILKTIKNCNENKFNENKVHRVGWAIENNNFIKEINNNKPYDGSYTPYRRLCHHTHNSISSIQERTVCFENTIFIPNNYSDNIPAALVLDYCCMEDINQEILKLL
ncbi:hypothetical protein [Clostridium sp.]|uniref:hypothetical protein n=1 Tax=Clostridium sp. TaxID=1506 RepID=UPI0035A037D7